MRASLVIACFYGFFAVAVLAGRLFIDYVPLHVTTIIACVCFVTCMFVGSLIGEKSEKFRGIGIDAKLADKIMLWLGIGVGITTTLIWFFKLQKYGSLEAFLANAYTIRVSTIGQGDPTDLPIVVQYFNSLVYALFAIALARLGQTSERKYTIWSAFFFVLIVMNDLTQLGRIGILYAIFCVIGYFIVYRKKILTPLNITCVVVLFALLMLPRLIRGSFDNFEASVRNYRPHFSSDIPAPLNAFVITYIYYFSSPYALDSYLERPETKYTYGERTFTPIVNLLARLTGSSRTVTIDEEAFVPFRYNIYTVLKDFYQDFGVFGISLLPLVIGIGFGRLFSSTTTMDSLKIFCLGWLFYTPIYNAYSFGGFMISFLLLLILCARPMNQPTAEALSATA